MDETFIAMELLGGADAPAPDIGGQAAGKSRQCSDLGIQIARTALDGPPTTAGIVHRDPSSPANIFLTKRADHGQDSGLWIGKK